MASSNEESPAAAKDKRSPPPFYIEGILRDIREKKEGEQSTEADSTASLLSAPVSCTSNTSSKLQTSPLSNPASGFIARPFPGIIDIRKAVNDVSVPCQ